MKNDVVYKVKILLSYESQLHKTIEMGALTSPFAVHKNDVEDIDDLNFSYIFEIPYEKESHQLSTDQAIKRYMQKVFINFYGKDMHWISFRILSIRRS